MTKIKPFGKKILVTEKENENVTVSGIVLSGKTGETTAAVILEVGPDVTEVKVGDVVYLEWGKGHPVKVDGKMMAIIDEQYIAAVVEE
jgi:co-chaperonin GroES (HSP10)